jgi:hypothetical protein
MMLPPILKRFTKYGLVATITVVLLLSQAGLIVWSSIKKASHAYIRQHNYSINSYDTIIIQTASTTSTDLVWHEEDEVQHKGQMFDIKHQYTLNGTLYLVGHFDSFDNKLVHVLTKLFNTDRSANNQQSITLWVFDAVLPVYDCNIAFNIIHSSTTYLLASAPRLLSPFYSKDAIPPESGC